MCKVFRISYVSYILLRVCKLFYLAVSASASVYCNFVLFKHISHCATFRFAIIILFRLLPET